MDIENSLKIPPSLQLQLQENFFRSHPPYLKQLCDINSERYVCMCGNKRKLTDLFSSFRIAASAVSHCEASILPQQISYAVRTLSEWLKEK